MNTENISEHPKTYDTILIGTGIAGGWAAKALYENGLKTLVLERGRKKKHLKITIRSAVDLWGSMLKQLKRMVGLGRAKC